MKVSILQVKVSKFAGFTLFNFQLLQSHKFCRISCSSLFRLYLAYIFICQCLNRPCEYDVPNVVYYNYILYKHKSRVNLSMSIIFMCMVIVPYFSVSNL